MILWLTTQAMPSCKRLLERRPYGYVVEMLNPSRILVARNDIVKAVHRVAFTLPRVKWEPLWTSKSEVVPVAM